jgi:hypothetical protein
MTRRALACSLSSNLISRTSMAIFRS